MHDNPFLWDLRADLQTFRFVRYLVQFMPGFWTNMAPKKDQKMIGEAPAHKKARIDSPSGTISSKIESHIKDGDVEPDSGNAAVTL